MNRIYHTVIRGGALGFMLLGSLALGGCSEESPVLPQEPDVSVTDEDAGRETAEVDVALLLGAQWDVDVEGTRAAPPGATPPADLDARAETARIDAVRLVTFRRKAPKEDALEVPPDGSDFRYDATNDIMLDLKGWSGDNSDLASGAHDHRLATGKIKKVYGYEYRAVAIAYESQPESEYAKANIEDAVKKPLTTGPQFSLNTDLGTDLTLDRFKASMTVYDLRYWADSDPLHTNTKYHWEQFYSQNPLEDANPLTDRVTQIPQLFYCECAVKLPTGGESEIIRFSEADENGDETKSLPLTGTLYRGMAKVELHIAPYVFEVEGLMSSTTYPINWIALLANVVNTEVSLTDYDGFLSPSSPIKDGADPTAFKEFTPVGYVHLPKCNKTGDAPKEVSVIHAYMLPGKTKLAVRMQTSYVKPLTMGGLTRTFWLRASDVSVSGGNGTGIVSPDSKDGVFYLRRNHKYVLRIANSDDLFNSSNKDIRL